MMPDSSSPARSSLERVRLSEFEDNALKNGANPPSTITWCTGSHEEAAAVIQQRFKVVVSNNPWIAGRIVQENGKNYLEYQQPMLDKNETGGPLLFRHLTSADESPSISRKTPLRDLGKKCADAGLILRFQHNFDKPLFMISIVPSADEETPSFAVIASMSHILGDGHTFYTVYNMLMSGQNTEKVLQAGRIDTEMSEQEEAMGKPEARVLSSFGFIAAAIRGVLTAKLLAPFTDRYQLQAQYYMVDQEKTKVLKKDAVSGSSNDGESEPSFVSTNDVLTSWFLTNSACQHGMMAINLRGRLPNYTDDKAGNYENLIYYCIPADCGSPSLIRRSLATLRRSVTADSPLPSAMELATGNFSIISNWATFAADRIDLGECKEAGHLPLFDYREGPASIAMALIFRYMPGQVAILAFGVPSQLEGLEKAPFASERKLDCHF